MPVVKIFVFLSPLPAEGYGGTGELEHNGSFFYRSEIIFPQAFCPFLPYFLIVGKPRRKRFINT
jgi:hypothetical protein